jgi:hypothetical protein
MIGVNGEDPATILPPPRLAALNCISVPDIILNTPLSRDPMAILRPSLSKSISRV